VDITCSTSFSSSPLKTSLDTISKDLLKLISGLGLPLVDAPGEADDVIAAATYNADMQGREGTGAIESIHSNNQTPKRPPCYHICK